MKSAVTLRPRLRPLRSMLALRLPRRLRRRLAALLGAVALVAGGYLFWLRDASFVRVERVTVTGLTASADAQRVRDALTSEARTMTTLHVRPERLERAVARYPVVRALEVRPDFPSTLRIEVVEHEPVAVAVAGRSRVAVGPDGVLLPGVPARGLPAVRISGALPRERLARGWALQAVRVAATAPSALRRRLRDVRPDGPRGFVARLRGGPELIFGPPARLGAKWLAAARVLADPAVRGAGYLDLRQPERPAAGGLAGGAASGEAPAGAPQPPAPPAPAVGEAPPAENPPP